MPHLKPILRDYSNASLPICHYCSFIISSSASFVLLFVHIHHPVMTQLWLCLNICPFFPFRSFHPLFVPPLPSVFRPNWRLKREFYILPASNDEGPLISVYPCRWNAAAATWDTSISFHVRVSHVLLQPFFHVHTSNWSHGAQTVWDGGVTQAVVVICCCVKWAVNSGG